MKLRYFEVTSDGVPTQFDTLTEARTTYMMVRATSSSARLAEIVLDAPPTAIVRVLREQGRIAEISNGRYSETNGVGVRVLRSCVRNDDGSYTETVRR